MVEHACRLVVKRTRQAYIYPANHYASSTPASQTNVPAMGQRLRLKSSFQVPGNWSKQERAVALGLQKYGALVADNGNFFSISITPDDRWPASAFDHIQTLAITNFEVIQTTGPAGGPRSPGGPAANAGPDQTVPLGASVSLAGCVSYSGPLPAIRWSLYSGPGIASFANQAQTNSAVSFSAPGVYTLMLSADDGVHSVAYDAVVFTVTQALTLAATRNGGNLSLSWTGGIPPYVLLSSPPGSPPVWSSVLTNNTCTTMVPLTGAARLFRVRSQ